jgi:predicted membrane channel-forming protein YqfA (hemolysin III family)
MQDHERLDVEEQAARTLTHGIGLIVGAIMLVILLILCARSVF